MNDDFRSEPSPSPEGKGLARRAWDAYARTVNKAAAPAVQPLAHAVARRWTMDMVGFYVAWHLYGGFEGLQEAFGMHPSTIWRKVAKFRKTFGVHPDEAYFKGLEIDTASFWKAAATWEKNQRSTESGE